MSTVTPTPSSAAAALATQEYAALLDSLRALPPGAWSAPTDCAGWTVRDVVAHVTGAAQEAARRSVLARHYLGAMVRDRGRLLVDKVNDAQVAQRRASTPEQLIAELEALAPKAVRGRERTPRLVRRMPLPTSQGGLPGDTMGHLNDVIYTRDIWMHRIDIARATETGLVDSAAEPEIVAQVMRDLSRAWAGAPFTLALTGRVPGTWRIGPRTDATVGTITVDAVALCRVLSGRSDETEAVSEGTTPEVLDRLRSTRILF